MKKNTKKLPTLTKSEHEILDRTAKLAKCLSNPKRLAMMIALHEGEQTVGDLAEHLNIASQIVSIEMRIMKSLGAVSARREHPKVFYRLADESIGQAAVLLFDAMHKKPKKSSKS